MMKLFHKGIRKHGVLGDGAVSDDRCSRCDGACCRGFFNVELSPMEYARLEALGASRLEFTLTGKFYLVIENGCEFLHGAKCSIYGDRPDICRRFSCRDDP